MGAIDMFYRFLCCFSLGDAAKNGQNTSSTSGSQSSGSQGRDSTLVSPSSSQSCWCGFLGGERKKENLPTGIPRESEQYNLKCTIFDENL